MRFDAELRCLEHRLNIPYPERSAFIAEVASDLERAYEEFCAEGYSESEAKVRALEQLELKADDIQSLNALHESGLIKTLNKLPSGMRQVLVDFSGVVPLVIFNFYVLREGFMFEFLREGGWPGVVTVLGLGLLGVLINFKHVFRWFLLRDHSLESLRGFTNGPLYLAAGVFLVGVVAAAAGYRIVFSKWSDGLISDSVAKAGLSEPLSILMLGAFMSGVIVLLHGWLASWKAKTIAE
jgi:hypothetical protein